MADDADKPDKPVDENENLVKALESIKTLLATNETRLSQARESISQASAHSLKMTRDVPVLDEVIIPGKPLENEETTKAPTSDNITDKAPVEEPAPKPPTGQPEKNLDSYKAELEKEMHDKMATFATELEADLKAKIRAYLGKDDN